MRPCASGICVPMQRHFREVSITIETKTDWSVMLSYILRDGRYGLVEVKLGGEKLINEGAATLKELADKIDTGKMKKPSFLMVLTAAGSYAFRREDGVLVVPVSCLKD